jgi:TP901 family phage tail tape measure protein
MANVTGEAAEDVSSYMTAVWNNFADGSKELTHYADVITALGAATASSSEEIAQGLQKFSAVANTVGLSYEYATSALATVVSQTRESADTVGTAFKTIFARLESLSLGDTLEDGTNLTKYSQALATVGVSIKDSNGQLKDMDTILDELGNKWKTIDKDQ